MQVNRTLNLGLRLTLLQNLRRFQFLMTAYLNDYINFSFKD
jgi:hypothetical protein